MAFAFPGAGALDYRSYALPGSRLLFRGPPQRPAGPFAVALGGIATFGKFVAEPYPALVERLTGLPVVNLGCVNAGPDAFLNDPAVLALAARAEVVVLQLFGAADLGNPFYAVHPRRNDRFLRPEPALLRLYPDLDMTEFHFTRHLLRGLARADAGRFAPVAAALRQAWAERMGALIARIGRPVVLLWFAGHPPPGPGAPLSWQEPVLVDRAMVEALRPRAEAVVAVIPSPAARAEGTGGMVFGPLERMAAAELPGQAAHHEAAEALARHIVARAPAG